MFPNDFYRICYNIFHILFDVTFIKKFYLKKLQSNGYIVDFINETQIFLS